MTKIILIDEYWNELERINLFSYDSNDVQYIHVEDSCIDYSLDTSTMLLLEDNDLELINYA